MRRYYALAILIAALLLPALAHAQEPTQPPPPPPGPQWSDMPDLADYLVFIVPQCGNCNGYPPAVAAPDNVPWPGLTLDIGKYFAWIRAKIAWLFYWLVCWLLAMTQYVANFLALLVNGLIFIGNFFWRFFIFSWLTIKSWFYAAWYIFEHIRNLFWYVLDFFAQVVAFIAWIIWLAIEIVAIIGSMLLMLLDMMLHLIGTIAYIAGLFFGMLGDFLAALAGTSVPSVISGQHIAYAIMRGALDAMFDSQVAWLLWLYIGMAYVAWLMWLTKFLGTKGKG